MRTIKIVVKTQSDAPLGDVNLALSNMAAGETEFTVESDAGGIYDITLPPGDYLLFASKEGFSHSSKKITIPDEDGEIEPEEIILKEEQIEEPLENDPCLKVEDLIKRLKENEKHGIEPKIDPKEAQQAIGLFSIANLMMAGKGEYSGGDETKTDVLGILNLSYGLQGKSLKNRITLQDASALWDKMEALHLAELAQEFNNLQNDIDFILKETKRQFNIGTHNNVSANTSFPEIFQRLVILGSDPLGSIDLKKAKENDFFDQEKLEKAYDILKDLKETIIEIVRSLSKYGTTATKRVNKDWAKFEGAALEVLEVVATNRVSEDQDDNNTWSVVAALNKRSRDEIIPYVALGLHGAELLKYALEIYQNEKFEPEDMSAPSLVDLFQPGDNSEDFWTTKIRTAARFVKRYPLPNWGS